MKNVKKYVALILAVAFIAILPLTAFAGSSDYLLPGTWNLIADYDTETGAYEAMDGKNGNAIGSAVSHIVFNSNGTASYYIGADAYSARWTYDEPSSTGGNFYTLTVNYNGSALPMTMLLTADGQIYLLLSSTIYIYEKR